MTDNNSLGERIAAHRRRRGISQTVLAGLVGRSVSWLSQVERGEREVDKLSVLIPLARALRVDLSTLVGEELNFSRTAGPSLAAVDAIRAAMTTYVLDLDGEELPDLVALDAVLSEINTLYQAGHYDRAGSLLPLAIRTADMAATLAPGADQDAAQAVLARTHQTTAALLSRVGETDLGWVAADRSITAARRAGDIELVTAGIYRLGQIMLRAGRYEEAFRLADSSQGSLNLDDASPSVLSLHGALYLTAAIAAAKMSDRREVVRLLAHAQTVADRLGDDRNDHWTAFGRSNVRIHATSAAVDLGDPDDVLTNAAMIDPNDIPADLLGRRSQLQLDTAWAYGQRRNDAAAVLALLEAERLAPQAVRHSPVARDLIQACLRRSRRKGALPGLDGLAQRTGVLT